MDDGIGNPVARDILSWIKRSDRESFRVSELTRNFPRFRHRPDLLQSALAWLVERNVIRQRAEVDRSGGKPGPKPLPTYDVNPNR